MNSQIYNGFWWFFGNKEEDIPGTLEIIDGNSFKLNVFSGVDSELDINLKSYAFIRYRLVLPPIIGIAKSEKNKDELFSLFECELESFRLSKIREYTFTGQILIKNSLVENLKEVKIRSIFFKPQFLDTWINEKSIIPEYDFEKKGFEVKIHYKQPSPITIYKDSSKHIYIHFRANFRGPSNEKLDLTQSAFINIVFRKSVSFDYLQKLIDQVRNWYTLVIGLPVSIDILEAKKIVSTESDTEKYLEILIRENRIYTSSNVLHYSAELVPFKNEMVKNGLALRNWFLNYELIKPSLQIYIDTLYNKHLYFQNQFLNYVFALEIYHKRKFINFDPAKEISYTKRVERVLSIVHKKDVEWLKSKLDKQKEPINLESRLMDLFRLYSYVAKPLKLHTKLSVKKIVQTRNRLVHHSEKVKSRKLLKDEDLRISAQKLRIIMQSIFLTEMGFDQDFIREHIDRPFNNSYYFSLFRSIT